MIIREWRGRAPRARAGEYPTHFLTRVVPELRDVPGFLGATLSKREDGERVEFVVLTRWSSMDAVRAFAGADLDRAVVEPGAVAALSDYDRTVRHYEVVEDVTPK
ncbi:antibiotic biosynthesis monooxygenase family protein [Steroidobacter flavus]|uniref:Antibiotic biosynthesis monooxygenase family protein n=1 Tax=Steroidobacter flavus TaxID=1842136 RepID=A0ABV8SQQ5_9GAMM